MNKTLSPFWVSLRETFLRADNENKAKLEAAFPELVRE